MSMFKDFKTFAFKGNVFELAVAFIIGSSFGKIITSLVSDIIMPPIGWITGGTDFSKFAVVLKKATLTAPAVTLNYGAFINTVLDFLIIALCMFFMVRAMNKFKKQEAAAASVKPPAEDIVLLREIRDALTSKKS